MNVERRCDTQVNDSMHEPSWKFTYSTNMLREFDCVIVLFSRRQLDLPVDGIY